jgi:hypothetical protein
MISFGEIGFRGANEDIGCIRDRHRRLTSELETLVRGQFRLPFLDWFPDLEPIEVPPFVEVICRMDLLLNTSLKVVSFATYCQLKELRSLNNCPTVDRMAITESVE